MPVKNGQNALSIAMLKNWSSIAPGQEPKQVKDDPGGKRTL